MLVLWWIAVLMAVPARSALPNIVVAINTFKWLRLTSDKFLGMTVSPEMLSSTNNYSETALTMLQGLAPSYLRVEENNALDLNLQNSTNVSGENTFVESQWASLNQFATDAGLRLIFSLNLSEFGQGGNQSRSSVMNDSSLQQLLSLSNQQGYNPVWQYAYETSSMMNETNGFSGKELGRRVVALRNILDQFPRYKRTAVMGPDFTIIDKSTDLQFLRDFMLESNDIIKVLVLNIRKTQRNKNLEEDLLKSMSEPVLAMSKMLRMPSYSGRLKQLTKKQLWIAESDAEGHSGQFLDAMTWALKLGYAGKLGYHVVLRRPSQLTKPTPDYWVSLLYRNLVGSAVLSTRLMSGHSTMTLFANCAAYYERAARSALDSAAEYERGAVVVWGVNRGEESAQVTLLTVSQEYAHLYALTTISEQTKQGKTLLNGKQLSLNHKFLPKLTPLIQSTSHNMSVRVPARSVFFIVLPHAGARACFTPAVLTKQEELINPQWEQWHNNKSPISAGGARGDFIFERGGIYERSEDVRKEGAMGKGLLNSKDDDEEKVTFKENKSLVNTKKELKNFAKTDTIPEVSKIKAVDNNQETFVIKNKESQEEYKNGDIEHTETGLKNKSEAKTTALLKNRYLTVEENRKLENTRVKRSNIVSESEKNSNNLREVEVSPLFSKVYYLQRNEPSDSIDSVLKSLLSEDFKSILPTNDKIPKKPSHLSQEIDEINLNHIQFNNLPRSEEIVKKSNAASKLLNSNGKEKQNFHYRPGAFYEALSGLEIDSNSSLADIEEQNDAFATILEESVKCEDCGSSLQVTKRPANHEEIDRKIVESNTEFIEQFLKNTENVQKHHSLCRGNKLKNGEVEYGSTENKHAHGKVHRSKIFANKKDETNLPNNDKSHNISSEKKFSIEKTDNNLSLNSLERITRDAESFKYISQIFNQNTYEELSDKNSTNRTDPGDMRLRILLQELTEEGEKLLNPYFGHEFEHLKKSNNSLEQNEFLNFSPVLNQTEVSDRDDRSDNGFFIKNNLISNNIVKPKKNYKSMEPVNILHNSNNNSSTYKVQNINSDNAKLVLTRDTNEDTEELSATVSLQLDELSSTEGNHNFKYYSKLSLPNKHMSESNKNPFLYSGATNEPFHNFFNLQGKYKVNQESNFGEINNNPETTKSQNKLESFQAKRRILPVTKAFNPLTLDELDTKNMSESSTYDNLYLKITLPNEEVSTSIQSPTPLLVGTRLDQESFKEEPKNSDTAISSKSIGKYLIGETKSVPSKAHRDISDKRDIDIKESMIISSFPETPRTKNSFFETGPPESELNKGDEETNQLNNHALNFQSQDNLSKKLLQLNKNINEPIFFQNRPGIVKNKTPGLLSGINEISPTYVTGNLLNEQKYKLEAFKEKVRKDFQNLRVTFPTPNFPAIRIPKMLAEHMITDLKRNDDTSTENVLKTLKQNSLVPAESKISVKKQLHSDEMPLFYDSSLTNRRKREASKLEGEEYKEPELTKVNFAKLETPSSVKSINNESDIVIESSYTPIYKWIIPLSNHIEKILMKNKIFPVKLFDVSSDDWQNQNGKKDEILKDSDRKPRSVQYSCMRDNFDDYSTESENVDGIKVEKDIKQVPHPSLRSNDNLAEEQFSSSQNYHRKRRSVRNNANSINFDIKSHLTNDIKKDEGISDKAIKEIKANEISDVVLNNNQLSHMLQKQLVEVMKNKPGVYGMFEKTKLYKKNHENNLGIIKSDENIKNTSFKEDSSEKENQAVAVPENKDTVNVTTISGDSKQNNLNTFSGEKLMESSNRLNSSLAPADNETTNESSNKTSNKNMFSVVVQHIKSLFKKFNTVLRKLLDNVTPLKPTSM